MKQTFSFSESFSSMVLKRNGDGDPCFSSGSDATLITCQFNIQASVVPSWISHIFSFSPRPQPMLSRHITTKFLLFFFFLLLPQFTTFVTGNFLLLCQKTQQLELMSWRGHANYNSINYMIFYNIHHRGRWICQWDFRKFLLECSIFRHTVCVKYYHWFY